MSTLLIQSLFLNGGDGEWSRKRKVMLAAGRSLPKLSVSWGLWETFPPHAPVLSASLRSFGGVSELRQGWKR